MTSYEIIHLPSSEPDNKDAWYWEILLGTSLTTEAEPVSSYRPMPPQRGIVRPLMNADMKRPETQFVEVGSGVTSMAVIAAETGLFSGVNLSGNTQPTEIIDLIQSQGIDAQYITNPEVIPQDKPTTLGIALDTQEHSVQLLAPGGLIAPVSIVDLNAGSLIGRIPSNTTPHQLAAAIQNLFSVEVSLSSPMPYSSIESNIVISLQLSQDKSTVSIDAYPPHQDPPHLLEGSPYPLLTS